MHGALLRPCHKWSHRAPLSMEFFPGKSTGVGCPFLLQGIFLHQGLKQHLLQVLHCRRILCWWAIKWLPGVNSEPLTLFCPFQTGLLGDLPKLDIHSLLGVWFANIDSYCIAAFSWFPLLWGGSYVLHHSLTFAVVVKSKPLWPRLMSGSLLLSSGNFMVSHLTSKS